MNKLESNTKLLYTFQKQKHNHDRMLNILRVSIIGDERQVELWTGDEWKNHVKMQYNRGPYMK